MASTIAATSNPTTTWNSQRHANRVQDQLRQLRLALEKTRDVVAHVWPLRDAVAVNPFEGLGHQQLLTTHRWLRGLSDIELLGTVEHFRKAFQAGEFTVDDVASAIAELVQDDIEEALRIDLRATMRVVSDDTSICPLGSPNPNRRIRTMVESIDRFDGTSWAQRVSAEISKHLADYFDDVQASWKSGAARTGLYDYWKATGAVDRELEVAGVSGVRSVIRALPPNPVDGLHQLLEELDVPPSLWHDYLSCHALRLAGWSGWTKYVADNDRRPEESNDPFVDLLTICVAYDAIVARSEDFSIQWRSVLHRIDLDRRSRLRVEEFDLERLVFQRAMEIRHRKGLCQAIAANATSSTGTSARESDFSTQVVFCIDVRSAEIRHQLEQVAPRLETMGFAGFFGLPIETRSKDDTAESLTPARVRQLPALLSPQYQIRTSPGAPTSPIAREIGPKRTLREQFAGWMKPLESSASTSFTFVELFGCFSLLPLLLRSLGNRFEQAKQRFLAPRVTKQTVDPTLRHAHCPADAVSLEERTSLALGILRGMGLSKNIADVVVLCGHECSTENNPQQAALQCGACGGHSGELNAITAAALLNDRAVRDEVCKAGISIPDHVTFLSAVHDTTTDRLRFTGPSTSSSATTLVLKTWFDQATQLTQRVKRVREEDVAVRAWAKTPTDWSDVRPEWGLTGNAAFIVGPRSLTENVDLADRAFLHSYDASLDPDHLVLEQILTAPMVVAHWINLQYYASSLSNDTFGSGNKTVHNLVGDFGLLTGSGRDLRWGLASQSVRNSSGLRNTPLLLTGLVAAPRQAISDVIDRHESLRHRVCNGWMTLVCLEGEQFYRLTAEQIWEPMSLGELKAAKAASVRQASNSTNN